MLPGFALAAMLLLAACGGSGGGGSAVASVAGAATTTTAKGGSGASGGQYEALLAYAKCMREHGRDVPDPTQDANGNLKLPALKDPKVLENPPKECTDKLQGALPDMSQQDQSEFQDKLLAYARCMRKNGYDMPDPNFSGNGAPFDLGDQDDPKFKAADEKCKDLLGDLPGVSS
ncbi:MAG TPA: hypothetical protein VKG45_07885 [Actinomycetes bacterium]|nr:hypothetical protein [Actinomycetes bacterium]